jgi:hypothetical protein
MLEPLLEIVVRLYPAAWRERYGEEFSALLEDVPPRWRDLFDVVKGAIAMQVSQNRALRRTALTSLAGLLIAFAVSFIEPPHSSIATLRAPNPLVVSYISQQALKRTSLADLILRYDLYHRDLYRWPMDEITDEMRRAIRIESDRQHPPAFTVQFQYPDRLKAQAVVGDLAALYAKEYHRFDGASVELLDAASLPGTPLRAFHFAWLLWGLGIGLLAGVVMQRSFLWSLEMAGFGLIGLAIVTGVSYIVPDRYVSTAIVAGNLSVPAPAAIQVQEIPMPPNTPKVYVLSAADTGRLRAQYALRDAITSVRPQITDVIQSASLPELPDSPNRLFPALGGLLAGFAIGRWRIKARSQQTSRAPVPDRA